MRKTVGRRGLTPHRVAAAKPLRSLAVVALGVALAAIAASVAAAQTCETERDLAIAALGLGDRAITRAGTLSRDGDTCRLDGMEIALDRNGRFEIARIGWQFSGVQKLMAGDEPEPVGIEVEVSDARLVPQAADPWVAWMLDLQTRHNRIDLRLAVGWDPASGVLEVSEFRADFPRRNSLVYSSRVEGFGPDVLSGRADGLGALRLAGARLEIENEGYLDGLYLGALIARMRDHGDDPRAVIAAAKARARAVVAALPAATFGPGSIDALARLVEDAPAPTGRLSLAIEPGAPLGFDRLLAWELSADRFSSEALGALLAGARVSVTYARFEAPE